MVKHVKRHGKRVKLVRQRVRWSCVRRCRRGRHTERPGRGAARPRVPTPTDARPATREEPGNPHSVGAQAYEYGFEPTGSSFEVHAGNDTIELINRGEDAHNLHLERLGSRHLRARTGGRPRSGQHGRGSATSKPGDYRLYCSLDDHAMKGMERTLVVP